MAEEATPQKVINIFSSLLASDNQQVNRNGAINQLTKEPATVVTTDARNKSLFYDRVQTYSPLTWFAKPLKLSPLVCARYGWKNTDTDMLQCVKCNAFLCGQLPKGVDSPVYRESCDRLKKNLIDSHTKMCTWATNPCPESFTCVPYHNKDDLVSSLCNRIISLTCASSRLPQITHTSIQAQKVNVEQLQQDLEMVLTETGPVVTDTIPPDQMLLAACGWSYSESQIDVLHCKMCYRKVGLWNYRQEKDEDTTDQHSTNTEEEAKEPPVKRQKIIKQGFDPLAEHRYWCPWLQSSSPSIVMKVYQKTGSSSNGTADHPKEAGDQHHTTSPGSATSDLKREPAWLLVIRLLSPRTDDDSEDFCKQMKQSPRFQGLRHLRKVLKDCTSPPKLSGEIRVNHPSSTTTAIKTTPTKSKTCVETLNDVHGSIESSVSRQKINFPTKSPLKYSPKAVIKLS